MSVSRLTACLFVAVFAASVAAPLHAQVVIRERVELNPASANTTAGSVMANVQTGVTFNGKPRGRGVFEVRVNHASITGDGSAEGDIVVVTERNEAQNAYRYPLAGLVAPYGDSRSSNCLPHRTQQFSGTGTVIQHRVEADERVFFKYVRDGSTPSSGYGGGYPDWTGVGSRTRRCPPHNVSASMRFLADPPDLLEVTASGEPTAILDWGSYVVIRPRP
ncbi:MAG: hypothetical protein AAGG50_01575, partial [Bacteroidota bacterium]